MEAVLPSGAALGGAASDAERADVWMLETIACSSPSPWRVTTYSLHGDAPMPIINTDLPARVEAWTPTAHMWAVIEAEHRSCLDALRTGDEYFAPLRLTDVVDMRVFRRTEYFVLRVTRSMPHKVAGDAPARRGSILLGDRRRARWSELRRA